MSYFSKSDLRCLQESLEKYGKLSFDDLYSLSHSEKSYCLTGDNDKIEYSLFIDDDNPMKEHILEGMLETSSCIQV